MFIEELIEINHYGNLFVEGHVKFHIRGLITINLIEKKTNCSLSNQELVEKYTNDLLKKQLFGNIPINLNSEQSNDVSINLVKGVKFLKKLCPKSHIIFQALPLFTLWLQYKKLAYLLMCLKSFFFIL
jgi:hypothetical protein